MSENFQNQLKHYGILRRSGRYPWGSGKKWGNGDTNTDYGRSSAFYAMVDHLKEEGLSEKEIAQSFGMSIADLRSTKTVAKEAIILEETRQVMALRAKGTSVKAIAERTGLPEGIVRLRLKNSENLKESTLRTAAEVIRSNVDKHDIVDIGKGVEHQLKIADTKKKAAIAVLRDEGYETYNLKVKIPGSANTVSHMVMVKPGTGFAAAAKMVDRIHTMGEWSEDGGETFLGIHPPLSISSKRVQVRFAEDGGTQEDGFIYVREGVPDLSMGKNRYAQVRIAVDGTHYIKGVAIVRDDLPNGVDVVFNTNKSKADGKMAALKPLKDDPDNPFGSAIKRQIVERDKNGKEVVTSALNLLQEEGDWDAWRNSLPSQVLAKQPHSLIKSQLAITRDNVKARLDEIDQITNAVVRKQALEKFADQIDSDAVELRAAQMPRQKTQVIIPFPKMNKNEIYAPNFETGESVVLVRYPHGGRFEIPEVVVNNNNRTAKKLLGNAPDAIGIHPSVAERLSGADFDGDTVVVIPNPKGAVKGAKSMGAQAKVFDDGLANFNPKQQYGGYVEDASGKGNFPLMTNTGLEMGKITNLITDMSIQAAKPEHVLRAVRHSMVVIDAEKHKLDYKASEAHNNISQLKALYQGKANAGATTLLSQATAQDRIPDRKPLSAAKGGAIDPETGALRYEPTGKTRSKYDPKTKTYTDEQVLVTKKVARLALTDDAYTLTRDRNDPVESLYADHANQMKALANSARLKVLRTPDPKTNTAAKAVYRDEVDQLVRDMKQAQALKPLERKANTMANAVIKAKRYEDPTLRTDRDRLLKVERMAHKAARANLGLSERQTISINERQWDAIQAGAVSPSRLRDILEYADPTTVTKLAMPRKNTVVTSAIGARAKAMLAAGATTADVARALGISASTLRAASMRGDI